MNGFVRSLLLVDTVLLNDLFLYYFSCQAILSSSISSNLPASDPNQAGAPCFM